MALRRGRHSGPRQSMLTLKRAGAGKVHYLHREGLLSKSIQMLYFIDVHQLRFGRQDPTTSKTAPEEEMGSSTKSVSGKRPYPDRDDNHFFPPGRVVPC